MMPLSLTIDDRSISCEAGETLLDVCRKNEIFIPTLCFLEGLSTVGACRLCVVEVEGIPRLLPACTTPAATNMKVRTDSEQLRRYRRMIVELLFAERNHVCAVCVANGACELQDLAYAVGMDRVRFPYLYPSCQMDVSHPLFNMDHNRCVMCTRCVRVCDEVEGAHTWDVMGRGHGSRVIADFSQPWGESVTCTSCGKCEEVCPVGAIWPKGAAQGRLHKSPGAVSELIARRRYR